MENGCILRRPPKLGFVPQVIELEDRTVPTGGFAFGIGIGSALDDIGQAVATDASDNVYVTGSFRGTVDFDPGPGVFNLTTIGGTTADIFVAKYDRGGNLVWARLMGGTSISRGFGIAVDSAGNVLTTGVLSGTADFDPGPGTFNLTSAGANDIFVSKLDSAGNFVWARQMGSPGFSFDEGRSIAVDSADNVLTTGVFQQTADFDPGPGTFNLIAVGTTNDVFVSKLDSAGNFVWARRMGGDGDDVGHGIAVDGADNVLTTGVFQITVDFDPGPGIFNLSSAGGDDAFVSKLTSSGNFVWARQLGGTDDDRGFAIAVDSTDNVLTTGGFQDTADFDPGTGTFNITNSGLLDDIFVSKLDSSGDFVWARRMGSASPDRGLGIAVDSADNVLTTGTFSGITADFDPGPGTFNLTQAGSGDIFVSKLDGNGDFVFASRMGGGGFDNGLGIAVDSTGNVLTTGSFASTADFDPGANTFNLVSNGDTDIFVSRLTGCNNQEDFGDAPASYHFATALHTATGPTLGSNRDIDMAANFSGDAAGDDVDGSPPDDEDGLVSVSALSPGLAASIVVNVQGGAGRLDAWIDFNGNGIFDHPSERITAAGGTAVVVGNNTINFTVPGGAVAGGSFLRLRLSTVGGLTPTSPAGDGEIEDYQVNLNAAPSLTVSTNPVTVNEGTAATNDGTFNDADSGDNVTITASVGTITQTGTSSGTWSWSFTPGDGPADSQLVTITADDGNGGVTNITFDLIVNNVAPTAGLTCSPSGVVGQPLTFTLMATDPSPADQAAGFTFDIDWDGNGTDQTVTGPSGTTVQHVFATTGTFIVEVTATDKDGGPSTPVFCTVDIQPAGLQPDPWDPAATALFIGGTQGDDIIAVRAASGGRILVVINGQSAGVFQPTGGIFVFGLAGNDRITFDGTVTNPGYIDGGTGNDIITGGTGNDVVLGRAGDDVLTGGLGRDLIIGGLGADELWGNGPLALIPNANDGDILIGGTTTLDTSFDSPDLCQAVVDWGAGTDPGLTAVDDGFVDVIYHRRLVDLPYPSFEDAFALCTAGGHGDPQPAFPALVVAQGGRFTRGSVNRFSRGEIPPVQPLAQAEVQPLLQEAINRWALAGEDVSALSNIEVRITDLPDATLGVVSAGIIWVDIDAAGHGWFIDQTPSSDSEFSQPGNQGEQGRLDLLTVLAHEIGHILGHDHASGLEVMMAELARGVRHMPA